MKVNNPTLPKIFKSKKYQFTYYININKNDINHIISGFYWSDFNIFYFSEDKHISIKDIDKYFHQKGYKHINKMENSSDSYEIPLDQIKLIEIDE